MPLMNDLRPAGSLSAVLTTADRPAESLADLALTVVPAQPSTLDFASLDDLPFENAWPPFNAWWMLGADSD